jgi:AcrR family transcriptional regulator
MPQPPVTPDPGPDADRLVDTRRRVSAAAFELFAARGYEGATVDAIAARAGIARRTFFRYFRSKDDVIFPDHDAMLLAVTRYLDAQAGRPPLDALCGAVRLVFGAYLRDPEVALQRYRLTRGVDALRDRELASVRRYERAFSRFVMDRLEGRVPEPDATLRADVVAATVVAGHNAVLREWLRRGADHDPSAELERALAWVVDALAGHLDDRPPADVDPGVEDGVVVAVFRADQPLSDVVDRISRSL